MRLLQGKRGGATSVLGLAGASVAAIVAALGGCGDDSGSTGAGGGGTTTSAGGGGAAATTTSAGGGGAAQGGGGAATTSAGGSAQGGAGEGGAGGGGMMAYSCSVTAPRETRGSAIALSPDDSRLVVANRDVGTVTVMSVDYADGQPKMTKVAELDLGAGSEPWQVAIDGCGKRAYVVLRKDQKLVAIDDLDTASPKLGAEVATGSEPTGVAISPNNTRVYVANWVEGTVDVFDGSTLMTTNTVDLNVTLAGSGLLGTVDARPALAHPRALAITNDGDADDTDESVVVTEWFAQRTGPEGTNGANADTNKKGLVYKFAIGGSTPTLIDLPPVADTGFVDHTNAVTGCYPNQVASVTVKGGFAYVTSTCASPKGPLGVFNGKNANGACTVATQAADCGAVGGVCNATTLVCNPNPTNVKTTTHPALSIVDLSANTATTRNLDKDFDGPAVDSSRMPLLPSDVSFFNDFAYLSAEGTDAVFRITTSNGTVTGFGSQTNDFINLRKDATDNVIKLPVGIATAHGTSAFAFVANEGSRDVTALTLSTQSIAQGAVPGDFRITASAALPTAGSDDERALRGKRFFVTGLGRWSLGGEGWGSCAACHIDGLTDNVTWYFARGPRQSTSLDGSFASGDPNDQRIFNWTAIFDEVADFEGNTRGVSGGVGAIVSTLSSPPVATDRINTATEAPPQQGLQGSSADVADPQGTSTHPHSLLDDWEEIKLYTQRIRSPRRPVGLVAADVTAGEMLFKSPAQGNCIGCHSGAKWTVSTLFYAPGDVRNAATASTSTSSLGNISWNSALNGFPQAIMPVAAAELATNAKMRFGAAPAAEQLQCALRNVGTFGVGPTAVGVAEVRQDMTTAAQGAATTGLGFNVPSLLGAQIGAPFYHAGNARTLEEAFDAIFAGHHQSAIAAVFSPSAAQKKQLVSYLLSIDESSAPVAIPAKGVNGGVLCFVP